MSSNKIRVTIFKMKKKFNFLLGAILAAGFMTIGTVSCGNQHKDDQDVTNPDKPDVENPDKDPDKDPEKDPDKDPEIPPKDPSIADGFDTISIAEAIKLANEAGETGTDKPYIIYGNVQSVTNPTYGEMIVTDGKDTLYIYGIEDYSTMENKPMKGDEVVLEGTLKTYSGKPEMGRAILKAYKKVEQEFNEADYLPKTIREARKAAIGDKVKITGVVAGITNSSGCKPNGFYLVDNTESIYIYDSDAVQSVQKGNKVTVLGERMNWISDKEVDNAAIFGYQGCIQVGNAIISENDKKTDNVIDTSWVTEISVKEIMEFPLDINITTSLFNVTGYIHKEVAPGYINYYIKDLDDATGTYVYTQSNGADFDWLDPYDGKLCDILLSPINCKCTDAGTTYRFLPLEVSESSYKMADTEVGQFVLDYYIVDQFLPEYNADPNLELKTSVSNEKLGFNDAKVTYTSDNENAIYFTEENGKTFMHTKSDGSANITMTVTYKGNTTSSGKIVSYKYVDVTDAVNVKTAIDAADGTTVKLGGIVVASLVNRDGFYIGDETGVIAVTTTKEALSKIHLGDEVYFEGTRIHLRRADTDETKIIGQSVISDSTLILNRYGHHQYSTATFDDTKTISDLIALPANEDHTTQVYKVKAKIVVEVSEYYSTIKICDSKNLDNTLMLYASNAMSQYKWLTNFKNDAEVEMEVMLCNWNDKPRYKGAVLSVTNGSNKIINNLNFSHNK